LKKVKELARKTVKCAYFNAQCLTNKFDDLAAFIGSHSEFSLFAISETHLTSDHQDTLFRNLGDLQILRSDRSTRTHGGVTVLAKPELNPQLIRAASFNGFCEVLWIQISVNAQQMKVGVVYRSPSSSAEADNALRKELSDELKSDQHVVLVGDFNLPGLYPNPSTCSVAKYLDIYQTFCDFGMQQYVTCATHKDGNILDLVLSTDPMLVSHLDIQAPFSTSDHNSILFELNVNKPPAPEKKGRPAFARADFEAMAEFFSVTDWATLLSSETSVQKKWDIFKGILTQAISMFVPMCNNQFKPRCNRDVASAARSKQKAFRKHRTNPSQARKAELRRATLELRRQCRAAKVAEESKVLNSGNLGNFYRYIKSHLTSKGLIPVLRNTFGLKQTTAAGKADTLNKQFTSVFTDDDGSMPHFPNRTDQLLDNITITPEVVEKTLKGLPAKTSFGPDGIPPLLLKKCAAELAEPLSHIFRASFEEGALPDDWLKAEIAPIFKKKGQSSDPQNYRPVSLTSACCKAFETIIKDSVQKFLYGEKLINPCQHGFRSRRSTLTNTLSCLNTWHKAVDDNKVVHAAFLDFAKAFDTVSHSKLMHKLRAYGISGKLHSWLSGFLAGRTQKVAVDGALSPESPVVSGVPQGSVLGPLLFLIYVNDLCEVVDTECSLFADDAKLYVVTDKDTSTDPTLAQSLANVNKWAKTWQLSLSVPKCTVFCFGTPRVIPSYSIDGNFLECVNEVVDLGVTLSQSAKTSGHCKLKSKKALQVVGHIFRSFRSRNQKFLLDMFRVYVRPIVDYNSSVWSPHLIKDVKIIERVQKRFTKRIPGLSRFDYPERLRILNLNSLAEERLKADLILTFRMLKNMVDLKFSDFFTPAPRQNTRLGHGHMMLINHVGIAKRETAKHFFSHRVPPVWNSLSEHLVNAPTLATFKARLKETDLSNFIRDSGALA
jgi:hypothetical protein